MLAYGDLRSFVLVIDCAKMWLWPFSCFSFCLIMETMACVSLGLKVGIFSTIFNNGENKDGCLPMSGMDEAAGGVESARSRRSTKKATNMFIPGFQQKLKLPKFNNGKITQHLKNINKCHLVCG